MAVSSFVGGEILIVRILLWTSVEVDDEDLSGDSEEDSAEPEEDSGGEFDLPPDGEDEENELFGVGSLTFSASPCLYLKFLS